MINIKEAINISTVVTKKQLKKLKHNRQFKKIRQTYPIFTLRLTQNNQRVWVHHVARIHSLNSFPVTSKVKNGKNEIKMIMTMIKNYACMSNANIKSSWLILIKQFLKTKQKIIRRKKWRMWGPINVTYADKDKQ